MGTEPEELGFANNIIGSNLLYDLASIENQTTTKKKNNNSIYLESLKKIYPTSHYDAA